MRKSRLTAVSLAVATLALAACDGGDERTPPPPPPSVGDPEAYFGVAPCSCFEYVADDPQNPLRLGIAVESRTDIFTPGHDQYVLRYRLNGQQRRADFFDPTDPELRINWVNLGSGDNDQYFELAEGLPFVTGPVEDQTTVEASTQALTKELGTETGTTTISMRADYAAQPVEASLDGGERQTLQATRILYGGLPWGDQVRWFVPGVGFVKLELELEENSGRVTWILNRVRTLEGGCPWRPGDPIPGEQICGI